MRIAVFVVLVAALAAGCGSSVKAPSGEGHIGAVNPNGARLVLVIDRSASMYETDPRRFNVQGPQLAVALSSSKDNVGIVTFSSGAEIVAALQEMVSKEKKLDMQDRLSRVRLSGDTNYVASLQEAAQMLKTAEAPAGSTVIFLTDGQHNVGGKDSQVLKETVLFAQKGWKVFVIGLGKDPDKFKLAREVAVRTNAAFFHVTEGEALMSAFLKILSQIFTFVAFEGGMRPIDVLPGTRRLMYLMVKKEPQATIAKLRRGEEDVDWNAAPNAYKYPVQHDPKGDFEAISVENPASGRWEAVITGKSKVGAILVQPAFSIAFEPGAPAGEYYEGEEIAVGVRATGPAETLDVLAKIGSAKATLTGETGGAAGDSALDSQGGGRWTGKFVAKPSTPGREDVQQLLVRFSYAEQGGGTWTHEQRATIQVKPGKRAAKLELSSTSVDLGTVWADAGDASAEVTVRSLGQQAAKMSARAELGRAKVDPAEFELPASGSQKIRITVPTGEAGSFTDNIVIGGVQTEDAMRVVGPPVAVKWEVVKFEGPASVDLGKLKPGQEFRAPVDVAAGGRKVTVEVAGLEGAKVVEEGGKFFVTGTVPAGADDKPCAGEVVVRVDGSSLPPRRIPARLEVASGLPSLKLASPKIEITTSDDDAWAEATCEFTYDFVREAAGAFKKSDLAGKTGKISAGLQQKVEPKDGWDGKSLKPGQAYKFTFKAYLSNDTPRGAYEGKLILQVNDGRKTHDLEIPVTVTFKE